jgi:hypothetical protein
MTLVSSTAISVASTNAPGRPGSGPIPRSPSPRLCRTRRPKLLVSGNAANAILVKSRQPDSCAECLMTSVDGRLWDQLGDTVRFPSVSQFVQDDVRSSPLSGHMATVSEKTRSALVREVGNALMSYVASDGPKFPIKAHLASARKRA